MYKTKHEFETAMKETIRCVLNGGSLSIENDADAEVLAECITRGYLIGDTRRTMDGRQHPVLITSTVPMAGLNFLEPDHSNLKSNIALAISAIALLISLLASLTDIAEGITLAGSILFPPAESEQLLPEEQHIPQEQKTPELVVPIENIS